MEQLQLGNTNIKHIEKPKKQQNTQAPPTRPNIQNRKDSFKKNNTKLENSTNLNTYQVSPKSNFKFLKDPKNRLLLLSSTIAIACTIALFAKGKSSTNMLNLEKINFGLEDALANEKITNRDLMQQLNAATKQLNAKNNEESAIIKKLNETIESLKKNLNNLCYDDKNIQAIKEKEIEHYQSIIDNAKLSYNPLDVPKQEIYEDYFTQKFPFKDFQSSATSIKKSSFIKDLLQNLNSKGSIEIPLDRKPNSQQTINQASLKHTKSIASEIGTEKTAGFKLSYGARTNWKNEKISRDIMQNFYDANGHTLDGVGITINKTGNAYKVKIEGNGLYNCDSLLELGSGNKLNESPYNAGGFGEGSRIVVANMLAQNKTSNIKFASSDWELDFYAKEGSVVRKINKSAKVLDGNYIEFETKDKDFIKTLVESINYFENSKNPDFQDLTFNNQDFGFKILPQGEKGNLYLTQRFEYGQEGNWENSIDGLNLIFRRKPDLEKYKKITRKDFSTGRDRVYFSNDDIYNLTKYFANDLSNEDLINALLSTKTHWFISSATQKETSAMSSFINALCDTCSSRNIGIDFQNQNICVQDPYVSSAIFESVVNMGYQIAASHLNLQKIGVDTVSSIAKKASIHKPINPSDIEIKKLKLLEEATKIVQESIQASYLQKLHSIYNECKSDLAKMLDKCYIPDILNNLEDVYPNEAFILKYASYYRNYPKNFNQELADFIDKMISKVNEQNIGKHEQLAKTLAEILEKNSNNNELFKQYSVQLKNLNLISKKDITCPRYIFDRKNEICKNKLGEAITDRENYSTVYKGHWVDKNYLDSGNFYDLLATWLHEICHKSGGDGTAAFTYKLTDLIEALSCSFVQNPQMRAQLAAIEEVFNRLPKA